MAIDYLSKLAEEYGVDLSWELKQFIYHEEIKQFNSILEKNAIDSSTDTLKDYADFKKSVLRKIHPDKGGENEDFIFVKSLQEKLNADLEWKQLLSDKIEGIQSIAYKTIFALKSLDTLIDSARLIYEPTIDNSKKLAFDISNMYSIYSGSYGYSQLISAADVLYKSYQGDYEQALKQTLTSAIYMALPEIIGYVIAAPIRLAFASGIAIYGGYSSATNIYSFYQAYGSTASELKSAKAYQDFTQTLANSPLQYIYDFASISQGYEIRINNINLALEKEILATQLETTIEFDYPMHDYIYATAIEENHELNRY
jgi:hypothetical protein